MLRSGTVGRDTHSHAWSERLKWASFLLLLSVNEHLMMCVQLFAYPYQLHSRSCSHVHADDHRNANRQTDRQTDGRKSPWLVPWWMSIEIVMIHYLACLNLFPPFCFSFLKAALKDVIEQFDGALCLLRIQLVDAPPLIYFKTHFSVRQKKSLQN